MPPPIYSKRMTRAVAEDIVTAWTLRCKGDSDEDIGKALGKTAAHIKNYLLQDYDLAAALDELADTGREAFLAGYQSVVDAHRPPEPEWPVTEKPEPKEEPEHEPEPVQVRPQFSFLNGDAVNAWFRSLESGVAIWKAADACGIDKALPAEWLVKAKEGSPEHAEWARVSRQVSAMAYIRLRERLAEAPAAWRGIAESIDKFEYFDAVVDDGNPVDEMREMLRQVLGEAD